LETLILAIESSCDETAAAVLRGESEVLSDVVASQNEIHAKYGGVVPELACRAHTEAIIPVVTEALLKAGVSLEELSAIAVTQGPGLVGALLVGVSFAKAVSFSTGVPLVPVNHLEAHIAGVFVEDCWRGRGDKPFIGLVVSGGHTSLYHSLGGGKYVLIGQTLDDAAGEAFDKVAKILGLGYPGGVVVDNLAKKGDPKRFAFPRPLLNKGGFDFSFSGLKTALRTHVEKYLKGLEGQELFDTCASFQDAVVDVLVKKTLRAAKHTGVRDIVVCGGVACNSRLRQKLQDEAQRKGLNVMIPRPRYCTDNAVMVASAGRLRFLAGVRADLDLNAVPTWPLEESSAR
jgi:N6-L-threonylcarbamoyladenine synthase